MFYLPASLRKDENGGPSVWHPGEENGWDSWKESWATKRITRSAVASSSGGLSRGRDDSAVGQTVNVRDASISIARNGKSVKFSKKLTGFRATQE
jgi:hypothetical protein